jgi:hypothetical protein
MTEDLWVVSKDHAWAVQSDLHGIVEEGFDCRAAAQHFIDDRRAAEAAEAEEAQRVEAETYAAESAMLDSIYREIARQYDADLSTDHPRNNAVKRALRALDSISVPVSEDREAA